MGFILQLGYFNLAASIILFSRQASSPQKNVFLLDCKESLIELLLDRTLKKPHFQSSCPVAGLVKGKYEI